MEPASPRMDNFWEDPPTQQVKYERNLNFAAACNDEDEYGFPKKKTIRDPMSHRIIEKRRRDRMNNCLADLSRLIPSGYLKKGRGRIEKTEIIEMAIKYMNYLQNHSSGAKTESCELDSSSGEERGSSMDNYRLGYQECLSETMHFLVEVEGFYAGDSLCVRLLNHLQKHCDKLIKGGRFGQPRSLNTETSSSSGYNANGSSSSCSDGNGKDNGASHCDGDWRMMLANSVSENESGCMDNTPVHLSMAAHSTSSAPSGPEASSVEHNGTLDILTDGSRSPLHGLSSDCGPSQLREMLQSPAALQGLLPLPGNDAGQEKRTYSTRSSSDDAGTMYKFKTNIKQRFNADLEHHYDASVRHEKRRRIDAGDTEERLSIVSSDYQASSLQPLERRSSDSGSPPLPASPLQHAFSNLPSHYNIKQQPQLPYASHQDPPASESTPVVNQQVPVFALHSKGSFYIPLTLDLSVLAPFMSKSNSFSPVLHPITISVNFCSPVPSVVKPERTLSFPSSWHAPQGERDSKECDQRGDLCVPFSSSGPQHHARWNCITERA